MSRPRPFQLGDVVWGSEGEIERAYLCVGLVLGEPTEDGTAFPHAVQWTGIDHDSAVKVLWKETGEVRPTQRGGRRYWPFLIEDTE